MTGRVVTGALFRSATEGMLWPALPGRQGAELLAQLYQLEHTQYLPEPVLRTRQLQQFGLLARHAAETSPLYRERFEAAGLAGAETEPWSWARFEQMPLLTRRELITRAEQIHSQRSPKSHGDWHELQTSGSTGEVVAVRRTGANQLLWLALSTTAIALDLLLDLISRSTAPPAHLQLLTPSQMAQAMAARYFDEQAADETPEPLFTRGPARTH